MSATKPDIHGALAPDFLADFRVSRRLKNNLQRLAAEYASLYKQRQRDLAVMTRRGEVEFDLTKGMTTSAQFNRYSVRQMMLGIEMALDACLGTMEGKRFRSEVVKAYGLGEDD